MCVCIYKNKPRYIPTNSHRDAHVDLFPPLHFPMRIYQVRLRKCNVVYNNGLCKFCQGNSQRINHCIYIYSICIYILMRVVFRSPQPTRTPFGTEYKRHIKAKDINERVYRDGERDLKGECRYMYIYIQYIYIVYNINTHTYYSVSLLC